MRTQTSDFVGLVRQNTKAAHHRRDGVGDTSKGSDAVLRLEQQGGNLHLKRLDWQKNGMHKTARRSLLAPDLRYKNPRSSAQRAGLRPSHQGMRVKAVSQFKRLLGLKMTFTERWATRRIGSPAVLAECRGAMASTLAKRRVVGPSFASRRRRRHREPFCAQIRH